MYAYVLGDGKIFSYEVGQDGGLSIIGGAVELPTPTSSAICTVRDRVVALIATTTEELISASTGSSTVAGMIRHC